MTPTVSVLVEFLRPDGSAVTLADLGLDFLKEHGLPLTSVERPFRVEVEGKQSKAGNTYYSYEHSHVTLPDGLETKVRINGVLAEMGPEKESKAGNPTRAGKAELVIASIPYEAIVYLTKGARPYWIKVHVQKSPRNKGAAGQSRLAGGRIV